MSGRVLFRSLLALLPTAFAAAQNTQPQRTDVPVRNVMLFSSGVGYFEHAGSIRGDGQTELRFRASQINDILKSLMLQDQDGGRVSTVTYPSQDPLSKTLRSFQVDITTNPSLADLLNQLRGARVTVQSQAERISGTILGVENRIKSAERGDVIGVPVLNVLMGASIRALELQTVSNLTLDDPQLQDELMKALTALTQARDQDKKPVLINFNGSGERRVRIGYVVETPIWKTSYRLLLDDKSAHLQGWAIVENQTESDWNGVSLSLVSGRPISFIMDLYQPLYSPRPTVVPELYASLRPQMYDGGIADERQRAQMTPPGGAGGRGGRGGGIGTGAGSSLNAVKLDAPPVPIVEQGVMGTNTTITNETIMAKASNTVQSIAQAAKLGELFQYTVPNVTLPRQKSAMLPIVTDSVSAEKLSIYNASVLASYPLNGVRLRNTTGKHLLTGPVTVIENNGYAGDARIDNLPPGQDRLLSYGIDLDVLVDNTKNTSTNAIMTARIVKGTMQVDRKLLSSREYLADNKGDKDKMLLIEHPIRQGWKLVDTQKPIESTPTHYRFQGNAAAKKVTTLVVKEELVQTESIMLRLLDVDGLLMYTRTGEIPVAVRDALARALQFKQALVETDRLLSDRMRQIAEISTEQARMRENMKTVSSSSQYYSRLLAKLNEQETQIEKLQTERDQYSARRAAQQKELDDYLGALTIG